MEQSADIRKKIIRDFTPIEPHLHEMADRLTGWLLFAAIIFGPWAFGTVQSWSIWTLNIINYLLGLLLAVKCASRWKNGYVAQYFGHPTFAGSFYFKVAAGTTAVFLSICLISVLNYAGIYQPITDSFEIKKHIPWLPRTYDLDRTVQWLAIYLGVACFFWALQDWVSTKEEEDPNRPAASRSAVFPDCGARLRRLLLVVTWNTGLLALQGIIQRLTNTRDLLWLVDSGYYAGHSFGPFTYRSHGAEFLNLLWPLIAAYGILHFDQERKKRTTGLICIASSVLAASGSLVSLSRAGAAVTLGLLLCFGIFYLFTLRTSLMKRIGVVAIVLGVLVLSALISGSELIDRFKRFEHGWKVRSLMSDRGEMIADDFAVWGAGAGVSDRIYSLYTPGAFEPVAVQLHNDWTETRISFGYAGIAVVLVGLFGIGGRYFFGSQLKAAFPLAFGLFLGLGGLIAHSRFDFPLQIYSILMAFAMCLGILFSISRR